VQFANIQSLIERRYADAHGAVPALAYPHFCAVDSGGDIGPSAALCFRIGWGVVGLWIGLCIGLIAVAITLISVWARTTDVIDR